MNKMESKVRALDGHATVANDRLDKMWQIEPGQREIAARLTAVEGRAQGLDDILRKHGLQNAEPILDQLEAKHQESAAALHLLRGELSAFGVAVDEMGKRLELTCDNFADHVKGAFRITEQAVNSLKIA